MARAASTLSATAVGQFRTSTASLPRSVEHRLERRRVALARRVADDVDRIARGSRWAAARHRAARRLRRQLGEPAALLDQAVGGEHADAAAVGDDRQAIAGDAHIAAERLDCGEQLIEGLDAEHAGAAEGGIVDPIRAGERAGVRLCCLRRLARCGPALITTTGFERAAARAADMNLRACVIAST